MAATDCCNGTTTLPVTHDYTPVGAMTKLGDMDMYVTGSGSNAIVVIYDIFGFEFKQVFQICDRLATGFTMAGDVLSTTHLVSYMRAQHQNPQVFQVCDRLAAAGFTVACADTFRGKPWPMSKMPPKPEDNFMGWITTEGGYERVSKDIDAVVHYLKTEKHCHKMGIVGFCWGVSITMAAGATGEFAACGGAHPSLFGKDKELAENLKCPVIMLPAGGDPAFEKTVKEVTDTKPFGDKCVFERFDDQEHGFCAARGDYDKPHVAAAATKAINMMADFFKANVQ